MIYSTQLVRSSNSRAARLALLAGYWLAIAGRDDCPSQPYVPLELSLARGPLCTTEPFDLPIRPFGPAISWFDLTIPREFHFDYIARSETTSRRIRTKVRILCRWWFRFNSAIYLSASPFPFNQQLWIDPVSYEHRAKMFPSSLPCNDSKFLNLAYHWNIFEKDLEFFRVFAFSVSFQSRLLIC